MITCSQFIERRMHEGDKPQPTRPSISAARIKKLAREVGITWTIEDAMRQLCREADVEVRDE